ncbi:MAG: transposase [Methyloprofundus sp.]|nr:transposase [Methyloprofundus sp.]
MPNYRRYHIPGACYFFTINLQDRNQSLLVNQIDLLRESVKIVKQKHPFHIDAWVVLPDHMHCIWTLPPDDSDFSKRWKAIKTHFSKQIPVTEWRSKVRIKRSERGIWQRRFWEHAIRDDNDYAAHINYIHFNPVKHGWVDQVVDWPYSTFHRFVENGLVTSDWAGGAEIDMDIGIGERRELL